MALFGKEEKTEANAAQGSTTSGSNQRVADGAARESALQASLGRGSRVEGKLRFDGSVRIDGQVDGEIEAQDTVIVGESAVINAQVTAGTIVVKGKVNGDVVAHKRVELQAPGKLVGNITTPSLVIHEGVVFEGHCSMGSGGDSKTEKTDKKVALFPKDDRSSAGASRMP
jgi:cytoskeletal protein CcmA (bactofilin family)